MFSNSGGIPYGQPPPAHGCNYPILYKEEDFAARLREITQGRGVDVVYDGVGRATFLKSLDCIRPMGMMVSFGNASGPVKHSTWACLPRKGPCS
ncbi:MAG: zinc-binding dehydrogenase [Desulfovibrionales bacterium]